MNQNQIFVHGEGDAWFNRNQDHIQTINQVIKSPDVRYILAALTPFRARIGHVLEIGCSNGIKLEAICKSLKASGIGIDPSFVAVNAGNVRKKNANIKLAVGTDDELPYEAASFDLVYFAFCLYLFDRKTLMQSLAQADRVLKPGGFLVITDFDPGFQHKRPYNHLRGVYSYKQDYTSFYTQTGLYYLVEKHSFSHRGSVFDDDPNERVSTSILHKELDPYRDYK
jgi:ubiquinone/menaquinone biosynthesis C-methylase UbiE